MSIRQMAAQIRWHREHILSGRDERDAVRDWFRVGHLVEVDTPPEDIPWFRFW